MKIGKWIIMSKKELAFHREVDRLIKKHPEYLDGIEQGIVHIGFNPGCKPKEPVALAAAYPKANE